MFNVILYDNFHFYGCNYFGNSSVLASLASSFKLPTLYLKKEMPRIILRHSKGHIRIQSM